MKILSIVAVLIAANAAWANIGASRQVEFASSVTQVQITDAQYDLVPTETITRPIPGCRTTGESSDTCEETIVVASEEVIRVYLSFQDNMFSNDRNEPSYTSVVFSPADFTPAQVELLKSVYPQWKHGFSNIPRKFARENFTLEVKNVKKPIKVVDMSRSKICPPIGDSGEPLPGCVEDLVYKDSWTNAVVATVTKK